MPHHQIFRVGLKGKERALSRTALRLVGLGLLVVSLEGCAMAPMLAMNVLSSAIGGGGGGGRAPSSYGGRPEAPNLRPLDQSVPRVLQAAAQGVSPICRAKLPSPMPDPLEPGECGRQPVCLPGAQAPAVMLVCAPASGEIDPEADIPVRKRVALDWAWQDLVD